MSNSRNHGHAAAAAMPALDQIFRHRRIMLTGGTGFLGWIDARAAKLNLEDHGDKMDPDIKAREERLAFGPFACPPALALPALPDRCQCSLARIRVCDEVLDLATPIPGLWARIAS